MADFRLPQALVIGPMKSGTSWIQDYLNSRGDVALPDGVKETFFFDRRYDKGLDWYASHFKHASSARYRLSVEVAPSYFHSLTAPERLRSALGDIPLMVTLRDPVRRAWSHYLHLRRYGYTNAALRDAVISFPEILEASRFRTCLSRWQAYFKREHMCLLWQEQLAESPDAYAKALCAGLDIPNAPPGAALQAKSNTAALPKYPSLAAFGDRTAHALRANRFYGVVNLAKRVGLKEVFFGKPDDRSLPVLADKDAQWLAAELDGEMPETMNRV